MANGEGPADAIRDLIKTLATLPIDANRRHVKDDLIALRRAFPADTAFTNALHAIIRELGVMARRPNVGEDLGHELAGWRRVRFGSEPSGSSNLRVIFRPIGNPPQGRVQLVVFGHRDVPESIYLKATRRPR